MNALNEIESRYWHLVGKINAPANLAHFATSRRDDGSAHVEREGDTYCYVVTERGTEYERRRTCDADELLYWLICDVVFAMASRRAAGQDNFRFWMFQYELEMLGSINEEWARRRKKEIDAILAKHPYLDQK